MTTVQSRLLEGRVVTCERISANMFYSVWEPATMATHFNLREDLGGEVYGRVDSRRAGSEEMFEGLHALIREVYPTTNTESARAVRGCLSIPLRR
jgi:hypothetical protein